MDSLKKARILNVVLAVLLAVSVGVIVTMAVLWPTTASSGQTADEGTVSTENEMLTIETPYVPLRYPVVWSERLRYEAVEENGVYAQVFYGSFDSGEVELFRCVFGETAEGTQIGYVRKDGAAVAFSVVSGKQLPDDTWSESDSLIYNEMVMDINDLIDAVVNSDQYIG